MNKDIWLVSRELEGWAEAGGIKDVVRDQARAFPRIGWSCSVALPLYGFLSQRVQMQGSLVWEGTSAHPTRRCPIRVWLVLNENYQLYFFDTPRFSQKRSLYTYTIEDETEDPLDVKGQGFRDSFQMNLEFQWAVVSFWANSGAAPSFVLGHDGHTGFLPAIARSFAGFREGFRRTVFALLVHNAGSGYRQEMPPTEEIDEVLGLSVWERRQSLFEHRYDPLVSAARHAKLATVSENYADELLTGRNDHWSGGFGRWLRSSRTPLKGITNGLSIEDKDPREPDKAGLPAGFDPLAGDFAGKDLCRRSLREHLLLHPLSLHGRLVRWNGPLYVMQGRLTAQKGIDALIELTSRALKEKTNVSFLIMAQGERRFEERLIHLARTSLETGRFLFANKFDEQLARLVFASGDFFLMPSEYEPCGLTDLKAQLMATLPIVHRVGGLVKVIDEQTGFSYDKSRGGGLWGAFLRSLYVWENQPEKLRSMRRAAFLNVLEASDWKQILEDKYVPWLTQTEGFPILSKPSPT